MAEALGVVQLVMVGVEMAIARGLIKNAQVSFEVVSQDGNLEFNYSAPKEED
jgi:hypothetical protein